MRAARLRVAVLHLRARQRYSRRHQRRRDRRRGRWGDRRDPQPGQPGRCGRPPLLRGGRRVGEVRRHLRTATRPTGRPTSSSPRSTPVAAAGAGSTFEKEVAKNGVSPDGQHDRQRRRRHQRSHPPDVRLAGAPSPAGRHARLHPDRGVRRQRRPDQAHGRRRRRRRTGRHQLHGEERRPRRHRRPYHTPGRRREDHRRRRARQCQAPSATNGRNVSADISRAYDGFDSSGKPVEDRSSESPLGDLVANALRDKHRRPRLGKPDLGIANPGGLRADLLFKGDTATTRPTPTVSSPTPRPTTCPPLLQQHLDGGVDRCPGQGDPRAAVAAGRAPSARSCTSASPTTCRRRSTRRSRSAIAGHVHPDQRCAARPRRDLLGLDVLVPRRRRRQLHGSSRTAPPGHRPDRPRAVRIKFLARSQAARAGLRPRADLRRRPQGELPGR